MSQGDSDIRVRPGRIRKGRSPRTKSFVNQVLRAAQKAGHVGAPTSGKRGTNYGRSTFGRGRGGFSRSRLFSSSRRVVIKARIVRHQGRAFRSAPMSAHLAYLKRDGVSRDGEQGVLFDADTDRADGLVFADRCQDDRHHFRFIVSPEDAGEMTDLKAFTRDVANQMQADLGTRLDWVAVDHWNTDNPHVHLLVRGVDETGADLVISRDYISRGLRSRAEDLVAIELGPKPELEIRNALEKDISADRWTRLDFEIRRHVDDVGLIDLRREAQRAVSETRRLMIGRLQHLEKMGLATATGPGEWMVGLEAERHLRDLSIRGDIIKSMHRAFTERGQDRGVADYVIDAGVGCGAGAGVGEGAGAGVDKRTRGVERGGASVGANLDGDAVDTTNAGARSPIVGRLVDKGLHDELTGEAYAVIDGTDGRAHHVRFRGIEAFEQAPPLGGIVEVRRFGGADDRRPTVLLATRSDFDLRAQITAPGATWLDHRLVERQPASLGLGGFGGEVRDALDARAEHLIGEGLARRQGQRILLQRDLLATLRQREIDAVGKTLSAQIEMPHVKAQPGETVAGIYRQRLTLTSGRFAMIEGPIQGLGPIPRQIPGAASGPSPGQNHGGGLGFQLVPWSREIERSLGQHIAGVARDGGGIDWSLGRKRGLGL